jgi:hypothetical protein
MERGRNTDYHMFPVQIAQKHIDACSLIGMAVYPNLLKAFCSASSSQPLDGSYLFTRLEECLSTILSQALPPH